MEKRPRPNKESNAAFFFLFGGSDIGVKNSALWGGF